MVQDEGIDQQDHGQEEVGHDELGRQLVEHGLAPQHDLGHYAGHQPQMTEQDQVGPPGPAPERGHHDQDHPERDDHVHQAVAELDPGVELEGGDNARRGTARPVAYSRARTPSGARPRR